MPDTRSLPPSLDALGRDRWATFCATAGDVPVDSVGGGDAAWWTQAFALSDYVYHACCREPAIVMQMTADNRLRGNMPRAAISSLLDDLAADVDSETSLMVAVRRFRHRMMVRIAVRDMLGAADLDQTMAELSAVAEVAVAYVVDRLMQWAVDAHGVPESASGRPQALVVVAMGKLGAGELNFSSDIDLIFVYPETGQTRGGPNEETNEVFFTRLVRRLMVVLSTATADGFVFRVDARLRPYGDSGPMVMTCEAIENYYEQQGREWERYAWIKARAITGDPADCRRLMQGLQPFVFRRYLDYGVFDALREMKQMIAREGRHQRVRRNIKLGAGGIREIEFFGQVFQLMRGGVCPSLQQRPIQQILPALVDEGLIDATVRDELLAAYVFWRNTEHRLQAAADQQTHDLPTADADCLRLAVAMGYPDWDAYHRDSQRHSKDVQRHFGQLLGPDPDAAVDTEDALEAGLEAVWQDPGHHTGAEILVAAGYADPPAAIASLLSLREDPRTRSLREKGRRWLDRLMPRLIATAGSAEAPDTALSRCIELIRAIEQRAVYLALLLENPPVLTHLVQLAGVSAWIPTFLAQHPVLLDDMVDPRSLFAPPSRQELAAELRGRLSAIGPDELEYQIESMCIFKQVNTLRVAAADVTGTLALMRTSDHLTEIAEVILAEVVVLAWRALVTRHGHPRAAVDDQPLTLGFAVIGYGKLGGIELGYGSDLDLVFLHAALPGETDGERPIDNAQFYAKLGQRIVHVLSSHTRAGRLYETDMRLRPSGSSGILVSGLDGFSEYQRTDAWTWEHQALVRARGIAGDPAVMDRFEGIRQRVVAQERPIEALRSDVMDMRRRMRQAATLPLDRFHLKQGVGGIVDLEFLVQYLVLGNAHAHPELARWSDNVRQLESLAEAHVLDPADAEHLKAAYLALRAAVHRLNLQELPSELPIADLEEHCSVVIDLWQKYIGQPSPL